MRAARLYGPGDVRVEEVSEPTALEPTQIVVAPLVAGLCGTDLKEYTGRGGTVPDEPHPLTGATKPQILGHEFSAVVKEVGGDVRRVAKDDLVAVMPLHTCGRCSYCLSGQRILCPEKAWVGLSTAWGGFGELAIIEEYQATPLGPLSPDEGALLEPAAVSLNAVMRAGVQAGDLVLVVGAGPVGLLALLAALTSGAARVIVAEVNAARAMRATQLGAAESIVGSEQDLAERVRELTGGAGVDRAIDCAGKDGVVNACLDALRPDGTLAVPAVHQGVDDLNVRMLTRKPATIRGSLGYTNSAWTRAFDLIANGRYPVSEVVTSRTALDHIVEDGLIASKENPGEVKILVDVSGV